MIEPAPPTVVARDLASPVEATTRVENGVNQPKLAVVVARQIEDEIAARGWPVGEVLASEPELLEMFGVSRAVLREAVRIVEHTGAATMRRGRGGGLVVSRPRRDVVASAAGFYFVSLGVTVGELQDAQHPLSEAAIELAAENATPAQVRRVVDAMDEMAAHRRLGAEDFVNLLSLVTDLSGNPVLSLFSQALGDVTVSRLYGTRARLDPPLTIDDALLHLRAYRRLVEAISAHDLDESLIRIRLIQRGIRQRLQDHPVQPRVRPVTIENQGKLGERIARLMRDDIEREGWPVGSLVGSEPDLIERYGVSRSVLREAIRISEFHGAVTTRRGPGGGMFVAQPDDRAIIHSARMVIDFEQVDVRFIWEARQIIEDACVRLAAERLDAATIGMLERTLAEEFESEEWGVSEHVVHHAIARATKNRPLVLFVDALAELSTARVREALRGTSAEHLDIAGAHHAHVRIIEAILSGDVDKAASRMRRHISAASASY
ncbi:MAG: FCD domain-containing protein [Rhodococcus fascians]